MTDRPRRMSAEVEERIKIVRTLIASGTTIEDVIAWLVTEQPDAAPPKTWKVTRQRARDYVNLAFETIGNENGATKDRKQARNRAALQLILQRLLAKDTTSSLRAAVEVVDKMCKIDGSYSPTTVNVGVLPTSPEEAIRAISHAHATMELAQRRGALPALSAGPPVITIEDEIDDEADDAQPEAVAVTGN